MLGIWGFIGLAKHQIGDLRPAFLPAKPFDTASNQPSPEIEGNIQIPLKLPDIFKIGLFAQNLGTPRDLQFSPEGVLLASIPSAGKVVALPDRNNDGIADEEKVILSGLNTPHGLAFFDNTLYVAEQTQLSQYNWNEETLEATLDRKLFNIPSGGNHITRSIAFDRDGTLYLTIGSTCNVCIENHPWYAAVVVTDTKGNNPRVFAKGLRNSVFLKVRPNSGQLWATDMGRDLIGDNIPPEEVNILEDGKDYGWPYCYGDKVRDTNFQSSRAYSCDITIPPTGTMTAHSAPLGLNFIQSNQFPEDWQGDLLVALHGSWNRLVPSGYKVIRMKVDGDRIAGQEDFITGFLPVSSNGEQGSQSLGRPVDIEFDAQGSLYISDDQAGNIYKVIKQ